MIPDITKGCSAGEFTTVTVQTMVHADYNESIVEESELIENWLDHSRSYHIETSWRQENSCRIFCQEIQLQLFAVNQFTYGKATNCNIFQLVLVCTENLDCVVCEDYIGLFCSFCLINSRLFGFLLRSCIVLKERDGRRFSVLVADRPSLLSFLRAHPPDLLLLLLLFT